MRTLIRPGIILLLALTALLATLVEDGRRTLAAPGITTRVSVDSLGNQGNARSQNAAISANRRFVAFRSTATNLVAGGTAGLRHIFVHDQQTGVTTIVSVDSAGNEGNAHSFAEPMKAA